jgi:signal recognition particle subunit SRP54
MEELGRVVGATEPNEIFFVADSMTGQDAVKSAQAFADVVPITGHVLTKLDGDARGGAALSIVSTTGKPIKFVGTGEKLDGFEPFRPDRMASRILGMGDVLSLIEKAGQAVDQQNAEKLARKLRREELTLEDFRDQLKQIKRMGSLSEVLSFLPGAAQMPAEVDEGELKRFEAILNSMTPHERRLPSVLNGSRRRRIAKGSGCNVSDVNRLLRRFTEARKMMKTLARGKGKGGKKMERLLSRLR